MSTHVKNRYLCQNTYMIKLKLREIHLNIEIHTIMLNICAQMRHFSVFEGHFSVFAWHFGKSWASQ